MRECLRLSQIYRHEYPQYVPDLKEALTELSKSLPTYRGIYQTKVDVVIDLNLIEKEIQLVLDQLVTQPAVTT